MTLWLSGIGFNDKQNGSVVTLLHVNVGRPSLFLCFLWLLRCLEHAVIHSHQFLPMYLKVTFFIVHFLKLKFYLGFPLKMSRYFEHPSAFLRAILD